MPIAEFSNWLRRVIWGRILRGRHHGTRLWNSVGAKWLWRILQSSCLFSVFSNINGEHESTLTTSKKYSWCIPVQKEIKAIIWGAAITPEPWNRQQCWFIFEDPNVRVARLLESLATMTNGGLRNITRPHLNLWGIISLKRHLPRATPHRALSSTIKLQLNHPIVSCPMFSRMLTHWSMHVYTI